MARRYAFPFDNVSNETASHSTFATVCSTTAVRPRIYDVILGSRATPGDYACTYDLQRFGTTGDGTATTVTVASALDPGDPAPVVVTKQGHTVEPNTYTANTVQLKFSLNQRATFRWVAAPGGEIILPATANSGVGFKGNTPSTAFAVDGTIFFEE